jgi:hydroxyacylglutathione hydrolase
MGIKVVGIPVLADNYVWCLSDSKGQALVVDPGEALPVLSYLKANSYTLKGILLTHHHWDHVNGVGDLLAVEKVPVYGGKYDHISVVTHPLEDGDALRIESMDFSCEVAQLQGHTLGHVYYYGHGMVMTGDTLFSAGCGRVFEGSMDQMLKAMHKIASLPDETKIYAGHEYTINNLEFALGILPEDQDMAKHLQHCLDLQAKGLPTMPSTVALEKKINLFWRCRDPLLRRAVENKLGQTLADELSLFSALRALKDRY